MPPQYDRRREEPPGSSRATGREGSSLDESPVRRPDPTQRPAPGGDPDTVLSPGGRLRALDGIRAFAVLAVVLYHYGISWFGGGLLGVDVFFVLSGYLITSLLCRELGRSGTVRLGRFWAQRARRLLPALFVLLLGVAAYARAFSASVDVAAIRADAIATLAYVSNWHFILSDQGYFALTSAPSPLLHTWSLAVEEQYYLLWPLVALVVVRRFGVAALAVVAGAGAVASAVATAAMAGAGISIDRLYYGTDTRAQALLVGSFLGAVGALVGSGSGVLPARLTAGATARRLWSGLGLAAAAFLVLAWHRLDGTDGFLYRGGFLLVAVAAGCVIVCCTSLPHSLLARCCSIGVLVFIGRISYGVYLYHWPLYLVIDHAHTGLSGAPLLVVRLAATFAVATASFVLLEEPIRTGRWLRGRNGAIGFGATATLVASAVVAATIVPATTVGAVQSGATGTTTIRGAAASALPLTDPVHFLLIGDSVALTLGNGLEIGATRRYGVDLVDQGALGCDLDTVPVILSGAEGPATPGCTDWRSVWRAEITADRPDVVGLLIGRWEVSDHLEGGSWVHVGEPGWDAHLRAELGEAIDLLSSRGAKVAIFTMPFVDPSGRGARRLTLQRERPGPDRRVQYAPPHGRRREAVRGHPHRPQPPPRPRRPLPALDLGDGGALVRRHPRDGRGRSAGAAVRPPHDRPARARGPCGTRIRGHLSISFGDRGGPSRIHGSTIRRREALSHGELVGAEDHVLTRPRCSRAPIGSTVADGELPPAWGERLDRVLRRLGIAVKAWHPRQDRYGSTLPLPSRSTEELEEEILRLKRIVAEQALDIEILKELNRQRSLPIPVGSGRVVPLRRIH